VRAKRVCVRACYACGYARALRVKRNVCVLTRNVWYSRVSLISARVCIYIMSAFFGNRPLILKNTDASSFKKKKRKDEKGFAYECAYDVDYFKLLIFCFVFDINTRQKGYNDDERKTAN